MSAWNLIGDSGIGKSHGYHGFLTLSRERSAVTNPVALVDQLFPPYTLAVENMTLWARRFFEQVAAVRVTSEP